MQNFILISNSLMPALKMHLLKVYLRAAESVCRYISGRFEFGIVFYIMHVLWRIPFWTTVQRDTGFLRIYLFKHQEGPANGECTQSAWKGRPGNGAVSHHRMTTVKMHE
jgi:hypothetical protein